VSRAYNRSIVEKVCSEAAREPVGHLFIPGQELCCGRATLSFLWKFVVRDRTLGHKVGLVDSKDGTVSVSISTFGRLDGDGDAVGLLGSTFMASVAHHSQMLYSVASRKKELWSLGTSMWLVRESCSIQEGPEACGSADRITH
jgi:hypothetical protein